MLFPHSLDVAHHPHVRDSDHHNRLVHLGHIHQWQSEVRYFCFLPATPGLSLSWGWPWT